MSNKIVWYIIDKELESMLNQFKGIMANHAFDKL